jgi:predicted metal-binding membrane protein
MTVTDTTILENVLRRDRLVVTAALIAVVAIAWICSYRIPSTLMSRSSHDVNASLPANINTLQRPA